MVASQRVRKRIEEAFGNSLLVLKERKPRGAYLLETRAAAEARALWRSSLPNPPRGSEMSHSRGTPPLGTGKSKVLTAGVRSPEIAVSEWLSKGGGRFRFAG